MYKVYFIDVKSLKEQFSFEELYSRVSSYRKNKVDKLKFEKDKWLSLAAEYLLMQALEGQGVDYSKVEIGFVENGKPVLKKCEKKLYFNLSHSDEMAMCTIADSEVGCDIQKITKKENYLDVAERFFYPSEIKLIKDTKDNEKREMFYRIWTLKESYMKATGKGFETPLKNFRISFENNKPVVYINDVLQEKYIFEERNVENSNYKSSICLKKE